MSKRMVEPPCNATPIPPFGFILHRANRVFTRMLDTELRPLGVSSAQLGPLIIMAQSAQPMLQRDLLRQSAIGQPAMVSAVNLLTRNGFIAQRRHEMDGRATLLELTERGLAVVEKAAPILARCNARAVSGLSPEQEQKLTQLIAAVISNLEQGNVE